ncbi:hypothetical protein RM533_13590 [Croceicoccus sp. F390]|uniref:Secreted protein n=1 Tax=Croceicoccus esteveae TaxID=3075597 RepID=A0ABU2ZME8_9SPHN|nr:hypothetical protein [Croceicoccus sp. F390]MDT0577188.1 hypothetical protein [Croceicoccus sp. F390]
MVMLILVLPLLAQSFVRRGFRNGRPHMAGAQRGFVKMTAAHKVTAAPAKPGVQPAFASNVLCRHHPNRRGVDDDHNPGFLPARRKERFRPDNDQPDRCDGICRSYDPWIRLWLSCGIDQIGAALSPGVRHLDHRFDDAGLLLLRLGGSYRVQYH